jgi:uncharacterized protein YdeI (YjbR/CyaY-like superfamily)
MATKQTASELPRLAVKRRADLREWLLAHHADSRGVWVVTYKLAAGGEIAWNDIVEEALCFGWIDSLPRKLDARRTMLRITPRKPTSAWSAKNKAHIADLERRGLLHEAGLAAIAVAKANGAWSRLDEASSLTVPDDLAAALASHPQARRLWDAFPPSIRRGILEWITQAKRPATRAARVEQTAAAAQRNERANQWRRPAAGSS